MPVRADRLKLERGAARPRREEKAAPEAILHSSILGAGNRAVAELFGAPPKAVVQRHVGWRGKDVVTAGHAWNADERQVGNIRRIPLEGFGKGLKDARLITGLSPESAKDRAIVLVPAALNAAQKIEVVVFLHGYTEDTGRPFAGWRALVMPPPAKPKPKKKKTPKEELLERLRGGFDPGDVAPVRDVALDQAAQQLEESKQTQTVIVLPQGGLHSQFGRSGDRSFNAPDYVGAIVTRLQAEHVWKDEKGKPAPKEPDVGRITMAGHSGAGATLANMANKRAGSSPITGDLVIFDAINGPNELAAIQGWARTQLNDALAVIKDPSKDDAKKFAHLQTMPKLRGYFTGGYQGMYHMLDDAIVQWFFDNDAELGSFAPCLRANFTLAPVGLHHEELMRGGKAGTARGKGVGNILDALRGLHPALLTTTARCPAMPAPLSGRKPRQKPKPKARPKPRVKAKAR